MKGKSLVALALVGGLFVTALLVSPASAAPPWKDYTSYDSESVTLDDGAGNVVLSDGLGSYTGDIGGIRDRDQSITSDPDQFWFFPSGRRTFKLSAHGFNDDECNSITFASLQNPDWFDDISAQTESASLTLDGRVYCWNKGQIPHLALDFNDQRATESIEAECLTVTKTGTTWTFQAPATGCDGDVVQETYQKGTVTRTVVANDVSLPFSLTAVISATGN